MNSKRLKDSLAWETHVTVRKYRVTRDEETGLLVAEDKPYQVKKFKGNVLLNEGITEMWNLITEANSATAFNNANADIGVGDGTTAEDASHTGLQGANTAYTGMESGFPSVSGQTATWEAKFGTSEANFAWEEATVRNGSTAGINLDRIVESMGTKTSSGEWTITIDVTLS